ncbi:MAG: ATP:cob(I)alamin adenosyltransferase [Pseudomonadota bacterium]
MHICRTVARRAERLAVELATMEVGQRQEGAARG